MPVAVVVDVDANIATLVAVLNRIQGMRTYYSCEATGRTFKPYIGIGWTSCKATEVLSKMIADWHDAGIDCTCGPADEIDGHGHYVPVEAGNTAQTVTLDDFRGHANSAELRVHSDYLPEFSAYAARWVEEHGLR